MSTQLKLKVNDYVWVLIENDSERPHKVQLSLNFETIKEILIKRLQGSIKWDWYMIKIVEKLKENDIYPQHFSWWTIFKEKIGDK